MAIGLDKLLRKHCPDVFINTSKLLDCIDGEDYINILKTVNFNGSYSEVCASMYIRRILYSVLWLRSHA